MAEAIIRELRILPARFAPPVMKEPEVEGLPPRAAVPVDIPNCPSMLARPCSSGF
jgi:hypothetical protein